MKNKKTFAIVLCILFILLTLIGCSKTKNCDYCGTEYESKGNNVMLAGERTVNYKGTSYLVNSSLDFQIGEVVAEGEDKVIFYEAGYSIIELPTAVGYGITDNASASLIYFIYENGEIVGSYKVKESFVDSEIVDEETYCILYDADANVVFKSDISGYLHNYSCSLASTYYDADGNLIADFYDYDGECKWLDENGNIINEHELREKLYSLSPLAVDERLDSQIYL